MSTPDPESAGALFKSLHYQRHNQRRQEHLATLGLPLHNRSVLEVGAGVGDHSTFFVDRGCRITSLEARAELCEYFLETYEAAGYADRTRWPRVINARAELVDAAVSQPFDVVYCYGLLYHLPDPAMAIRAMARRCLDLLLLETCVSFGNDEAEHRVPEPMASTQSVVGMGCRPTRVWVFNRLAELFDHVYVPATQPNHEEFPLDWTAAPPTDRLTRAVFIASRRPLESPLLLDHIPDRQARAP